MYSRRRFVKIGAASIGSLALRNFGLLPALAQNVSGYKALVCVFLFGGNDSNNTIIPAGTGDSIYNEYAALRGSLALPKSDLVEVADITGKNNYYFHNGLTEMASLFSSGHLAVAANVGPLVTFVKRTGVAMVNGPVPQHLFSHLDQQTEWQTSDPTEQTPFGWGGRTAALAQSMNKSSFPTLLSVAGNDLFGAGVDPQIAISATADPATALNLAGFNLEQPRSQAFDSLLTTETGLKLAGAANGIMLNSIADAKALAAALSGVNITTTFPETSLGNQLKQVATIIKAREKLGMQRQIFFCSLGGFDTHTGEIEALNGLYPELSQAISTFYTAINSELGISKDVTLFTESDFSRTFSQTTTDGSDHAWGSHHMVVGGLVKGQQVYGTFPTFELGTGDDFDTRGRWIPSAAVDQYGAALVNWFGVNANQVFPNLAALDKKKANPFTFLT
jgi:uncharacterized protein (DUF1501 family)